MTQKNRKPGAGHKKEDGRRGGFKKSHEYEEHEYSKRSKNEYLHIKTIRDVEESDEELAEPSESDGEG